MSNYAHTAYAIAWLAVEDGQVPHVIRVSICSSGPMILSRSTDEIPTELFHCSGNSFANAAKEAQKIILTDGFMFWIGDLYTPEEY